MMLRTRFAPSPTGSLHLGGVHTALYSWLVANKNNGKFILRIEDTDINRTTRESIDSILGSLTWLGITWNEGPFYQTDRMSVYKNVIQSLIDSGHAYYCYCDESRLMNVREKQRLNKEKPKYDGKCRDNCSVPINYNSRVVRFRSPTSGKTEFDDIVHGCMCFDNYEFDDLIIQRSDGTPTYNFCVVVDDHDMGINHVIRGDDHLNNTPRQILIYRALGWEIPKFAHIPMILAPDKRKKLSKRDGALSVIEYKKAGYLPEAVLSYIVNLGWHTDTVDGETEILTIDKMIEKFDLRDVSRSPAAFNPKKLEYLNGLAIRLKPLSDLTAIVSPYLNDIGVDDVNIYSGPPLEFAVFLAQGRSKNLVELAKLIAFFYVEPKEIEKVALDKLLSDSGYTDAIKQLRCYLAESKVWSKFGIFEIIKGIATKNCLPVAFVAQILRIALTGSKISPPIDDSAVLLGRVKVIDRLDKLISLTC
jgi:glutamyl-tRNA synthetase